MLRVVIVDDEPIIIRNIQRLFSLTDTTFSVVGTATNGEQGYQLIKTLKPDLACIDVSMPILDGMQMTERLRGEGDTVPIVIISGYSEFEKAQRALQLQVLDYLVKPLDAASFAKFVENIKPKLVCTQHERKQRTIQEMLSSLPPTMQDTVQGPILVSNICFGPYRFFRSNLFDSAEFLPQYQEVQTILSSLLPHSDFYVVPKNYPNECVLVIENPTEQAQTIFPAIFKKLVLMYHSTTTITMVYTPQLLSFSDITKQAQTLDQELYRKSIFTQSSLYEFPSKDASIDVFGLLHKEMQMLDHVTHSPSPITEIKRLLLSILHTCEEHKTTQRDLLHVIRTIFAKLQFDGINPDINMLLDVIFSNANSYDILYKQLLDLLYQGYAKNNQSSHTDSEGLMMELKSYLDAHYCERIRIQDLAEQFGFNYSYLCIVFRKLMGVSPNEYLINKRIQEAQYLLVNLETLNIKSIAASVGYEDSFYFSRIFKQNTGMTPSEFRTKNIFASK